MIGALAAQDKERLSPQNIRISQFQFHLPEGGGCFRECPDSFGPDVMEYVVEL